MSEKIVPVICNETTKQPEFICIKEYELIQKELQTTKEAYDEIVDFNVLLSSKLQGVEGDSLEVKIDNLKEALRIAREGLEFYTDPQLNSVDFIKAIQLTHDFDLNKTAREAEKKIKEMLGE